MRILHVNDVANVATTLATFQRERGHTVEVLRLRLLGGARSSAVKALALPARAAELVRVHRHVAAGDFDVVHIHYAYLGMLGALGRYPYVLHCHGTDVRLGLRDAIRRPLVLRALAGAALVLVATPDLLPIVRRVRPDATFLPDPVNTHLFFPGPAEAARDVLVHAALSDVKRTDIALAAIRRLRELRPGLTATAVDYGPNRDRYRGEPGIDYVEPRPHEAMADLVREHRLVLGQFGIGSLGMAELETMACGRPVACHFEHSDAYAQPPPVIASRDPEVIAGRLVALLDDPAGRRALGAIGQEWTERTHGGRRVAAALDELYRSAPLRRSERR